MDMRHFAKILITQGLDSGLTREDFEKDISRRAEAFRAPGESREQAFTKYITTTSEGALLFKAAMAAKPRQAAQDFPAPKAFGPAGRTLNELAASMAREKSLSMQESYSRLISDPSRENLIRQVREEERRATEAVTRQRWPLNRAERDSETREWLRR